MHHHPLAGVTMPETFECPNCGEDVPVGAAACPACGSDEETGWSEDTAYDGLDLPGWDDEPISGSGSARWLGWVAAGLVVVIVVVWVIGG
ncbi:MAG: zinc-ribbon domain-containing protein [Planctomycetota bacterium]